MEEQESYTVKKGNKQRITIRLDHDLLAAIKAKADAVGQRYQSWLNEFLRTQFVDQKRAPLHLAEREANYHADDGISQSIDATITPDGCIQLSHVGIEAFNFEPGMQFVLEVGVGGGWQLRSVEEPVSLVEKGGVLVAATEPVADFEQLVAASRQAYLRGVWESVNE